MPEGPLLVEVNVFAGSFEILQFRQSLARTWQAIRTRLA
jgi:hypothetical protein